MHNELMGNYVGGVPHLSPKGMRTWLLIVVSWMTTLAILCIFLRLISRRITKQKLWWDDYMIMFSMVSPIPLPFSFLSEAICENSCTSIGAWPRFQLLHRLTMRLGLELDRRRDWLRQVF